VAVTLLLIVVPATGTAQVTPPAGESRGMRGMRADDPRRAELEKRFQQRIENMVRQRLQLTDDQAVKLREVASRTETARRTLRRDEMEARKQMRAELLAGDNANETKVAELLEQMPRLERRRIDLLEQEQRELAKFLSAVQRARYFALQDELRRNMQELQRRRMGADDSTRGPGSGAYDKPMRRRPPGTDR
jgi:Spy/CpxP family protein refolding chaperone